MLPSWVFRDLVAMGHRMEDEASTSEHEEMPPLAIQDGDVASDGATTLQLGACPQQDADNEDSLEGLLEVQNTKNGSTGDGRTNKSDGCRSGSKGADDIGSVALPRASDHPSATIVATTTVTSGSEGR